MNNEEQNPRDIERSAEPDLVDPDSVVLDEGTISAEALEPELSVSPDTLSLQEPALGAVEISKDTAEAASLEDAAAEARAVAEEAEKAGTLVGGPMPTDTPTVKATPDGTAPAGGKAGDTPRGMTVAEPEPGGPDARPGLEPGNDHDDTEAVASPDEILADTTTDTTTGAGENATPHPDTDEILADTTAGTTENATPHPDTDEIMADSRGSASGGPVEDTQVGSAAARSRAPGDSAEDDPNGPSEPVVAGGDTPGAPTSHADPSGNLDMPGRQASTSAEPSAESSDTTSNTPLLLMIGGGIVVLGLIIWLVASLVGGSEGDAGAQAASQLGGACLADLRVHADQHLGCSPSV